MTFPMGASAHFPGQPDEAAQDAKIERLREAQIAEMLRNGIRPDDVLVPVRIPAGEQYRDPRSGTIGRVATEAQYRKMEKQEAEDRRVAHRQAAANAAAEAARCKAVGPELEQGVAALEAERDALAVDDARRIGLEQQISRLRIGRVNTAIAEAANHQTARDEAAAAKNVKVVPIPRPTVYRPKSLVDRDADLARRKAEGLPTSASPFPQAPRPGSDDYFGIRS